MLKSKKNWFMLLLLLSILVLKIDGIVMAQGQCVVPTFTREQTYSEPWLSSGLTIYSSKSDVDHNDFTVLEVEPEEWGCETYDWKVIGTGWHFDDTSGPTELFNVNKNEKVNLWADSTACGIAKITVTDQCNQVAEKSVRSTTGDYTVLLETCGVLDGWHQSVSYQDGFKYVVDHFNCSYPETDSGDICPDHPCSGCSSLYCGEGSEKWGWGCSE